MKMAKPSAKDIAAAEELQQVLNALDQNQCWGCAALEDTPDFFQLIDDDEFDPEKDRHAQALYNKLVTLMRENPSFHNRVISGMCHVIMYEKNEIIDPDSECIDLHPRFAEMWNDLKRETQAARYWNKRYHQVVAERDVAQAKLAAMESQHPIGFFNSNRPGNIQWESGVFLTRAKDGDPIYWLASSHSQQSAQRISRKDVQEILESFSKWINLGDSSSAITTWDATYEGRELLKKLNAGRCPSHESEQHSFGESEFMPVDLLLKPDLTDEDVERWRKQNLETKLAAVDEVITMLRRRPLPNDPFIKSGFCEAIVAVVTMRSSMNQEGGAV